MSVTIITKDAPPTVTSMGEIPKNGRRMLRVVKRYASGRTTVEYQPVPETDAPYFWIPSLGAISEAEMRFLIEAQQQKAREKPSDAMLEWRDANQRRRASLPQRYRDFCDARGEEHVGRRRFLAAPVESDHA